MTRSARRSTTTWRRSESAVVSGPEQVIQTRILRELKRREFYAVKIITANRNGVPDILACIDGMFVGIEVKAPGGRVSKLQDAHQQWIKDAGGIAVVVRSWEELKEYLGLS